MTPPKVVRLDDIEAVPGPGTLTWRPVRLTLGIEAFGTNAYTAEQAGVDVVEPHTESPEFGHQELYFVDRGRARFTLDGKDYDAPAGTYVFVPTCQETPVAAKACAATTAASSAATARREASLRMASTLATDQGLEVGFVAEC